MLQSAIIRWRRGHCLLLLLLALATPGCGDPSTSMKPPPDLTVLDSEDRERCPGPCCGDTDCLDPAAPYCNRSRYECVPCLPTNDKCPNGTTCHQVNQLWQCVQQCHTNSDCTHGRDQCCNGLCSDSNTDVANCGSCGTACNPATNGSATCLLGRCALDGCNAGYADCDRSLANGCEVATGIDPVNCGGCGKRCTPFANGIATCTTGICSAICAPTYADCDNNTADGCEIHLTDDATNCGACSKACAMGAICVAGKCQ